MEKRPDFHQYEKEMYMLWEESGAFTPERDPTKKPYTIILPPPNASGKMHTGNVLMIAIEDLLIRWKRMQGYAALWIPGTDHAGFETQTTFERKLKEKGKSRFDFDRQTLYDKIMEFVMENKHLIEDQMRIMGASVDWSRYVFTLDQKSIDTVINTFTTMVEDGKVYRADYLVNYSFRWGTTFSDAEVVYKKQIDPLYYIRYRLLDRKADEPEYVAVATVRPETIFVDTHAAVNPDDESKRFLVGRKIENPLTKRPMAIIADSFVDPVFGSGIVKITPAHDKNDYEVARQHNLDVVNLISLDGTLNENGGFVAGLAIKEAREKVVAYLQEEGLIEKIDAEYEHLVPVDYRSGDYIEQLVIPNWFVNVKGLKEPALEAVKSGEVTIYPKWREITYIRWMENMHDWAISRQVVWGIRIPAWYDVDENPTLVVTFLTPDKQTVTTAVAEALLTYSIEDIATGLQSLIAPNNATYVISKEKPGDRFLQETDTFDTWFSSGQWPLITLGYPDSEDFTYFYPTSVLETGWEIVTRWVSRMVMFGVYLTGKPPFSDVYLHGLVKAIDGRKMSKSLGNVINPEDYMEEYGVDALRMGLISGTANGKDFNFPHDKIVGYKKFITKIWNMGRFIVGRIQHAEVKPQDIHKLTLTEEDTLLLDKLNQTITTVNTALEKYRFADAADTIYQFMWHDVADTYIESTKDRADSDVALSVLLHVYIESLKLLHPFMPFVTEKIYQGFREEGIVSDTAPSLLITAQWPHHTVL